MLNQNTFVPPEFNDLYHFGAAVAQAETGVGGRDVIQGRTDGFPGPKEGIPLLLKMAAPVASADTGSALTMRPQ